MSTSLGGFLVIGLVFGSLAALMAFIIFYREYDQHRLGKRRIWRESLIGAAVAFTVFVALALVGGYLLGRVI